MTQTFAQKTNALEANLAQNYTDLFHPENVDMYAKTGSSLETASQGHC